MKIGILTSSRADFGIYLPLLKRFQNDASVDLEIIAFGTHVSKFHGFTLDQIKEQGLPVKHTIDSMLVGDTPNAISTAYALAALKFAEFWNNNQAFDFIFALGDRYEMAAAVTAAIPYQMKFIHLHGGETTLGAIDNIYRDAISLASSFHFVSAEPFKKRLLDLLGSSYENKIFVSGSLSLENLVQMELLSKEQFAEKWGIDLDEPTILTTFHPETVDFLSNITLATIAAEVIEKLSHNYQIVVTMPNADTSGTIYRNEFLTVAALNTKIKIIENFGTQSYFTCMKYSEILLGNTSSGIVEAASFGKYVVNVGDRQKGRLAGPNVLHVPFDQQQITDTVYNYSGKDYQGENLYFKPNPSEFIFDTINELYGSLS